MATNAYLQNKSCACVCKFTLSLATSTLIHKLYCVHCACDISNATNIHTLNLFPYLALFLSLFRSLSPSLIWIIFIFCDLWLYNLRAQHTATAIEKINKKEVCRFWQNNNIALIAHAYADSHSTNFEKNVLYAFFHPLRITMYCAKIAKQNIVKELITFLNIDHRTHIVTRSDQIRSNRIHQKLLLDGIMSEFLVRMTCSFYSFLSNKCAHNKAL